MGRDLRKLVMIVRLAGVLRVSVVGLIGQLVLLEDEQPNGQDLPAVRDELMALRRLSRLVYGATSGTELDARHLAIFA